MCNAFQKTFNPMPTKKQKKIDQLKLDKFSNRAKSV